jgi:parallel beta-helix repeat protein
VLLALLLPAAAFGQLACGDTIPKGQKVTLTADLGPCDGDSGSDAAIFVDGGTLDLAGHTVTCADVDTNGDTSQGIALFGKKAKVMNGTVIGCQNGIFLAGDGKHLVMNMTVVGSVDDGIDTNGASGKNKIVGNTFTENGNDGMSILSDKNKLSGNTSSQNVEDGIDLLESADKNKLIHNTVLQNGDDGIEIGGEKNKITSCTASNNVEDGFDFEGTKNKIRSGVAQGNGEYDVTDCTGNKVVKLSFTTASPDCQ